MEDERFRQDLDELFRLFKRLVEEKSMDDIPGVNKQMLQQFQFFFSNYEEMKNQIAYQLQGQFGDSVKEMVHTLVKQLREELGEEDNDIMKMKTIEKLPPLVNTGIEKLDSRTIEREIEKIDKLLKNPDLTQEQIDELLDRRADLKKP